MLRKNLIAPIKARYPLAINVLTDLRGLPIPRQAKLFGWVLISALASSLSPLLIAYVIRSVGETTHITRAAVMMIAAYFAMRLIDMVMTNPTLYHLSYRPRALASHIPHV